MKNKIIVISIFFTVLIFISIFTINVYAANYSYQLIDICIPDKYEKYIEVEDEDYLFAIYEYNDEYHARITLNILENYEKTDKYTQEDLDYWENSWQEQAKEQGDSIQSIKKELVEISGCLGMRWVYKYDYSSYYEDMYYFLTDKYAIRIRFDTDNFDYICSEEQQQIINSFRVKDTVLKSRGIPFTDISSNKWYYSAVKYAYENNMIKGTNAYTFAPEKIITRGMLVTILHRMQGAPDISGESKFLDVQDPSQYYYTAIKWAGNKGIISGYNNGKFGPNDPITREQLAVILSKYCRLEGKYKETTADLSKFSDGLKVSSFAKDAMEWAVGSGVITGSNGKLNPKGTATRAEVASMLYKYCRKVK